MDKDLDALLNDTANNVLPPKANAVATVPPEIKPWLASSANVPKEVRDKWTNYVKIDRNAKIPTRLQPSNSYRSWDTLPSQTNKLINELVRKAATQKDLDETKLSKLLSTFHPNTETDYSKALQAAFAEKILKDMAQYVLVDANYEPEKFPELAAFLNRYVEETKANREDDSAIVA